jgi:uncharacterized protein YjbI with pentapeptide repeats
MADKNQVEVIKLGVEAWAKWRRNHSSESIDLLGSKFNLENLAGINLGFTSINKVNFYGANLRNANFREATGTADFSDACLINADFSGSKLAETNFHGANLSGANFSKAYLGRVNFSNTNLTNAIFHAADLYRANLTNANLLGANLSRALLVESILEQTQISNCDVYGISVWDVKGEPREQENLRITRVNESVITVDNLQVAQFVYLLINRKNLRNVLDSITSKVVLILGRFTPERKKILDVISNELRKYNLLPIIFDFERPADRDFTETIKTLAGISLFIIADITSPKSSPLELQATVPDYQIPFVPIIQAGEEPFSMLNDLIGKYRWVLQPVLKYSSSDNLLQGFKEAIIDRAWKKHQELQKEKTATIQTLSIDDFINKNVS